MGRGIWAKVRQKLQRTLAGKYAGIFARVNGGVMVEAFSLCWEGDTTEISIR